MKHISFDQTDGRWLAQESAVQDWDMAFSEDNYAQQSRLRRNLLIARAQVLTSRQQEILLMRYERHMKIRDIAEELRINPSTVSRTLHRAESKLRAYLQFSF